MATGKKTYRKTRNLFLALFLLSACENDMKEVNALTDKKTSVEEGYQIESYLSQSARMKAKLVAPLMRRYQIDTPYVEFPRTLHVDFFDDSLRIESRLDARYGKYKENEQKVFLKDSVVASNLKGDTLWCRELWWDQQLQQFYTDKAVRIRQPDKMIYGKGMKAAQDLSWFNLDSVTGIIQVPREGLQ
ncbi:MAG: LPS export ABC transporter periplasmic protein LptC [Williamsia sp.]|nr:LPS export ABC transporter periplasmic protein LptC [Williamsia sp.]